MTASVTRRALMFGAPAALLAFKSEVRLGCQTNSWPIDPKKLDSFASVVERVKGFGFGGIETSFRNVQEHYGQAAAVKAVLARAGQSFFGVHIFLQQYDPATRLAPVELYGRVVDGAAPMGAERLILSGAGASPGGRVDREALERKCAAMNAAAAYAKQKGIGFAYHNHGAEFAGGAAEMEALYAGTDAKLVRFILDTGHARRQKADIPAFLRRHHNRIDGIHLRDLSDRPGDNPELGPFDLAGLAAALDRLNWKGWLIVEEENAIDKAGDDAVRPAREALRRQFGS
jgi:sugar phosphate isomerase/epimerase